MFTALGKTGLLADSCDTVTFLFTASLTVFFIARLASGAISFIPENDRVR